MPPSHAVFLCLYFSGTHREVLDALSSFGIPRDVLPFTDDGSLSTSQHKEWLARQKDVQSASFSFNNNSMFPLLSMSNFSVMTTPTLKTKSALETDPVSAGQTTPLPQDVLCGRGKIVSENPGNIYLKRIIDKYADRYDGSDKTEKTILSEIILGLIKETSGRFLKKSKQGGWEEISDLAAREKIAHTFRNLRRDNT